MKRTQAAQTANTAVSGDPTWDRVIDQIKGLSAEQRLKLSENIKATAIADIKAQQSKIQGELTHLSGLLGTPVNRPAEETLPENASTADRILSALRRGGNKTVKMLQEELGTPWVNTALSQLLQSKKIVKDGNRPAAYSLR